MKNGRSVLPFLFPTVQNICDDLCDLRMTGFVEAQP
jgi:hypothetical protein